MPRQRQHQDAFFHRAKREGFVARSAYKLMEIDDRRHVLRRGDCVLDLGCAPGSWMQVAAQRIGPAGRIVGVDLQPVEPRRLGLTGKVRTMVADAFEIGPEALLEAAGLKPSPAETQAQEPDRAGQSPPGEAPAAAAPDPEFFDVVLSDMAPKTTGAGDHFLSVRLCDRVLDLCESVLKSGGHLVMKVFEGEQYPDLLRRTASLFADAKGFKPKSSRDVSREMFIIAKGYRGGARARGRNNVDEAQGRTEPDGRAAARVAPGWGKRG